MDSRVVLGGMPRSGKCARDTRLHSTSAPEGEKKQEQRAGQELELPAAAASISATHRIIFPALH